PAAIVDTHPVTPEAEHYVNEEDSKKVDTHTDVSAKSAPKPIREQAKVLFTYEAQNDDELTIKKGDIITIISKEIEDLGWWKGQLNGHIGVFPDNFVELIKPSTISTNEDLSLPPKLKKPERPPTSEKPVNSCVPSKVTVNSTSPAAIVDTH
ncbi:SH3 domain-containing kinase-binding protein 1-like protein, partial [Leptotrombidium deliense]